MLAARRRPGKLPEGFYAAAEKEADRAMHTAVRKESRPRPRPLSTKTDWSQGSRGDVVPLATLSFSIAIHTDRMPKEAQARASYVAGSPVPLPLPPGPEENSSILRYAR